MLARLPKLIEPLLLADRNAFIEGELPVADLDRIAGMLSETIGNVAVKLWFAKKGKLATIEGQLSGLLMLECQRCLEAVQWPFNRTFNLAILSSMEQAKYLPDGYEPLLLLDEDKILLKNIVEDELLFDLPDIPKHQDDCITPIIPASKPGSLPKSSQASIENPFSVLANLTNLNKAEASNGSTKK